MKQIGWFVVISLLVSGIYTLTLVFSAGSVVAAYLITEVVLVAAQYLRLMVFVSKDDDDDAISSIEQAGVSAFVMAALFIGFYANTEETSFAANALHVLCAIAAALPFTLSYVPLLKGEKRIFTLLPLAGMTAVFANFQPPLEGSGRLMEPVINLLVWAFGEPSRAYMSGLVTLFILGLMAASRVYKERRTRFDGFLAMTTIWLAGISLGLYLLALYHIKPSASAESWTIILGWIPCVVSMAFSLTGFVWLDRKIDKQINLSIGFYLVLGTILFSCLNSIVPVLVSLLIVLLFVVAGSASVLAGKCMQAVYQPEQNRTDHLFNPMIGLAGASILLMLIYTITLAPRYPLWLLVALCVYTFIFGVLRVIAAARATERNKQALPA